jgi:hypothetical protein
MQNSSLESGTKKPTNDVGYEMKIADHDDKINQKMADTPPDT